MHESLKKRILIAPESNCWLWIGAISNTGYGNISIKINDIRKTYLAHRYYYQQVKGIIPKGMILDHICRVRNCVNPEHLEPVTQQENVLRGDFPKIAGAYQRNKIKCKRGHIYSEENTRIKFKGKYKCRECQKYNKRNLSKNYPLTEM